MVDYNNREIDSRSLAAGSPGNPIHIRDPDLGDWTGKLVWWTRALVAATIVSAIIAYFQWTELQNAGNQTNQTISILQDQASALKGQLAEMKTARESVVATTNAQLNIADAQAIAMQGQLDEMVADRRPWLEVVPKINQDIMFSVFYADAHIFIPVDCEITNYGDSPARNVICRTRVDTVPPVINNDVRSISDTRLSELCKNTLEFSKKNKQDGLPIFQNKKSVAIGSGSDAIDHKYFNIDALTIYMVQGCVDYTYADDHHGQTTFRYLVGKFGPDSLLHGIEFIRGGQVEGAGGNLTRGSLNASMLDFVQSDGGNYTQ